MVKEIKVEEQKSDENPEPIKKSRDVDKYIETTQEYVQITMMTLVNCMNDLMPLLQDENIFEVYINPDGKVRTDSFRGREFTGMKVSAAQVKQIILNVAALTNQLVTDEKPAPDAEIPCNE